MVVVPLDAEALTTALLPSWETDTRQIWPLTHFHSVGFLPSRSRVFFKKTHNLRSVVGGVLGPLCLAPQT